MSRKRFGDTFLWTNNNREICVYDKFAEMKANKADIKRIEEMNLLRIEYRLKSNKVIKNLIGTNTIPGLLQNWNRIPSLFKSEIKKKLFRGNTKTDLPVQTYFSPRQIYELYQKELGNYSYNKFIKDLGFIALADLFSYDIDKIKEMIMMGSCKRTVNRRLQELLKAMKNPVNRIIQKSGITLGELYDEIYRGIDSV